MPVYNNPIRQLNSLRRPALLSPQDQWQQSLATVPDPDQPAGNLSGLQQRDPSLQVEAFNQNMLSELRERQFNAARLGEDNESSALAGLAKAYQGDIASGPLARQRDEVDQIEAANRKAQLAGFSDSAESARYDRGLLDRAFQLDRDKLLANSPVEAEKVRAQGQKDLAREYHYNNLEAMLRGGGDLKKIGSSRNGSLLEFQTQRPQVDPKAIAGAANTAQLAARWLPGAMQGDANALATFNALKAQALSLRQDVNPDIRDLVSAVLDMPEMQGMTAQQALELIGTTDDVSAWDPQDRVHFQELFNSFKNPGQ